MFNLSLSLCIVLAYSVPLSCLSAVELELVNDMIGVSFVTVTACVLIPFGV